MKMHIIGTGTATVSKYINTSCVFEEDDQLFLGASIIQFTKRCWLRENKNMLMRL